MSDCHPTTIYLDESGDLGFTSPSSSTHLTLACVSTTRPRVLKRAIRKLKQRNRIARGVELKATRDSWNLRRQLLALIPELGLGVRAVTVFKPNAFKELRGNPNALYNYVAGFLLVRYLETLPSARLVVDLREVKVKGLPYQLDGYLKFRLFEQEAATRLTITHEDSLHSPGIQLADVVANAVWRNLERDDSTGYDLIRPRIRGHMVLWQNE